MEQPEATAGNARAIAACAAAGLLGFLFFFRPITDDDVWLHFAAGRWILEHGAVPMVDAFSFTAPGTRYVDHEWLAQLVFEAIRRVGGLTTFRASLALAAGGAYSLFAAAALRFRAPAGAVFVGSLYALSLQWHLARLRPHLLTLLFLAILVHAFLARDRRLGWRGWLGFAALIVAWGNTHAAAVIAPAVLGIAAASCFAAGSLARARRLAILAGAAAVLLLVNPYGFDVYRYAFETQALAPLIPEWKPLIALTTDALQIAQQSPGSDFRPQVISVGFLAAATLPLAAWALAAARRAARAGSAPPIDPVLALPAAVFCLLPFLANRHDLFIVVPVCFDVAAVGALAAAIPTLRWPARAAAALAAIVAISGLAKDAMYRYPKYAEGGGAFADVWDPHTPSRAVAWVNRAGVEGNCVGRLAWGGYLLFHSYPRLKVAFDGRITTYGAAIYHDIVGFLQGRKDEEVAAKYGFDLAIVQPYVFGFGKPREDPTFVAPDRSQNWVIVYRDEDLMREGAAVVALRRGSPLFEKNMERVRAAPPK
jgi:hypothetical protein